MLQARSRIGDVSRAYQCRCLVFCDLVDDFSHFKGLVVSDQMELDILATSKHPDILENPLLLPKSHVLSVSDGSCLQPSCQTSRHAFGLEYSSCSSVFRPRVHLAPMFLFSLLQHQSFFTVLFLLHQSCMRQTTSHRPLASAMSSGQTK